MDLQVGQNDPAITAQIAPLLPAIYDAASNTSRWPDVFAAIVSLLGGNAGLIFSHQATPEQQGIWVPYRCSEEGLRRYAEHYHQFDIWMQRGHELGVFVPGNILTSDDLLPRKEFLASVFYREFLSQQDIHDLCCGVLHDGSEPGVPIVHVAIYRTKAMPLFGEAEKALLAALVYHLRAATRIGFSLGAAMQRARVMDTIAETIAPPLMLLDNQGKVLFASDMARALLAASGKLRIVEGRLIAEGKLQARLDALLKDSGAEEAMLGIAHSTGKHSLWLIRVPVPPASDAPPDARRPAMALLVHDPASAGEIDLASFAKANGLTRAEARLAGLLLEHAALPPIAEELGVSLHTIRSQLRTLREKTGVRRQVELVKMLMSWPRRIG